MKDIIERQGSRGEREQLNVFSPRPVGQTCGLNLASLCGDQLQNTKTTRQSKQCKILRGSLTEGVPGALKGPPDYNRGSPVCLSGPMGA